MFKDQKIGFLGGGNMGEAMIKGLIAASLFMPDQIHVFDVSAPRMQYLKAATYRIQLSPDAGHLAKSSQLLILAVKPQVMPIALKELRSHLSHHPLVISIAAGIPIAILTQGLRFGNTHHPSHAQCPGTGPGRSFRSGTGTTGDRRGHGTGPGTLRAIGNAIEVDEKHAGRGYRFERQRAGIFSARSGKSHRCRSAHGTPPSRLPGSSFCRPQWERQKWLRRRESTRRN